MRAAEEIIDAAVRIATVLHSQPPTRPDRSCSDPLMWRVPLRYRPSVWADVSWTYTGGSIPGERNMYQLVEADGRWVIAVLTPVESPPA